jgi:hypothetical protein
VFHGRRVGPSEPAWTRDDRAKALAWRRYEAELCPGCRTRDADWKADRFAHIGQQRFCPGCEVLEQERQNVPEEHRGWTHVYLAPAVLLPDPAADVDRG